MVPIVHVVHHGYGENPPSAAERPTQYRHTTHILGLLVRGGGRYQLGDEDVQLSAPTLGLAHEGERDGNGIVGRFESYWVAFAWPGLRKLNGLELALDLPAGRLVRRHWRRLSAAELRQGVRLFEALRDEARQPDPAGRLRAGARLFDLLALWADTPAREAGQEPALRTFRALVDQYACDASVSLEQLAERVGLSADYLSELFRCEIGLTPVAYRAALRLSRAKDLLLSTPMPIAELAAEAGYPDANYFARVFRAETGRTPRQFRKEAPHSGGTVLEA
jgi:AraC-like DNA-binding protein